MKVEPLSYIFLTDILYGTVALLMIIKLSNHIYVNAIVGCWTNLISLEVSFLNFAIPVD